MKKYIIPLPLVLATLFFVWKGQDIKISNLSVQLDNSGTELDQIEESSLTIPAKTVISKPEMNKEEVVQISSDAIANDIRPPLAQAPPVQPKVIEILEKVKVATRESRIETTKDEQKLDTRVSLVQTSMKHPLMILEERGKFFGKAQEQVQSTNAHVATHFILQVRPGTNLVAFQERLASLGCEVGEKLSDENFIIKITKEPSIDEHYALQDALENLNDFVELVEPDYLVYAIKTPNDPKMIDLWGMHNSGQTGGTDDKDIDAFEAWDFQTGSKDVLVGVIDTGVDRTHQDLAANMWTNPNEISGNGIDDDGNGFVDDLHGWDFYDNDNNPTDGGSHGTHCAGTIGAVGNNGKGVVGVSWNVSMVGIRFLGPMGGYTSDAVKSVKYATKIGVALTSNSWGGGGFSNSLKNAIDEAGKQGIGFVAAAGNSAYDNDSIPSYPASYESENIISVGAHDHKGKIAWFSQWGKKSVDLFAPGVNIVSTIPGNNYASFNGTSMATPHVSGAYALLLASNPNWSVIEAKNALMSSVDLETGLSEKCVSGGRLNIFQASTEEPPSEKLLVLKPASLDFGTVSAAKNVELEFSLINQGTASVSVNQIKTNSSSNNSENLMGHWTFDGNTDDSSDNQNHGNLISGEFVADREGNPSSALYLDGVDDHVVIPHSDSLNPVDQFSVSVWLKIDDYTNEWMPVVNKGGLFTSGGKNREYAIWTKSSEHIYLRSAGNGNSEKIHSTLGKNSQWFHYGLSLDRKNNIFKCFLNGKIVSLNSDPYSNFNNNEGDLIIGSCESISKFSKVSNFKGYIDDLRLYNVALKDWTFGMIVDSDFVADKKSKDSSNQGNLMGHWKLDGNAEDSSDNQNDGNLISGEFVADREGNLASSLYLDGVDNHVVIPHAESLNPVDQLSVSVWLKIDDYTNEWMPVVNKGGLFISGGKNREYAIWTKKSGHIYLRSAGNGNSEKIHSTLGKNSQWFHYGLSLDRKNNIFKCFLNGKIVSLNSDPYSNFNNNEGDLIIGSCESISKFSKVSNFKGYIDDLRLYNVALDSYDFEQIINGPVENSDSPFVVSIDLPTLIEPGTGLKGTVTFSSDAEGVFEDTVTFSSDAENASELDLSMVAEVQALPRLEADPESMHFGLLNGETKSQPLTLSNVGNGELKYQIVLANDPNGEGSDKGITSLWGMGKNEKGELGIGNFETQLSPVLIQEKVVKIAAGLKGHSLFTKSDGSLWAMGGNLKGQLGDGSTIDKNTPTKIINSGVEDIAAGDHFSLFIKKDGSLWGMGGNFQGQLSNKISSKGTNIPLEIFSEGTVKIAAGTAHTLVLRDNGSVWGMGENKYGQLGLGYKQKHTKEPMQIFSQGVIDIAAGYGHSIILKNDGSLWGMGRNSWGQLGNGTSIDQVSPIKICDKNVNKIGVGSGHSFFIKDDGSLWGMGSVVGFQKEKPSADYLDPFQIFTGGVKNVEAGLYHSFAVKEDKSLWVVGFAGDGYGVLGTGKKGGVCDYFTKLSTNGALNVVTGREHTLFLKGSIPPEQPLWLTIDSKDGDLGTGESGQIQITANADLLQVDSDTAYIIIESNDLITPKTVVTVTADKLGDGKGLVFIPGKVDFEDTYVGQTEESPLSILNAGTEKVTVSKFVFMNSAFSHHLKLPFDLDAGEKINTTLYFEPNYEGQFDSSALVITSDNEPYKFSLSGKAVMAPALVYSPGQISESLSANEEKTVNFEIKNTGGSPLTWSMKGATPKMGSSFSLGQIFGMEHFAPVEKGAPDSRMGSLISTMGGGPDFHGYSWTDSNDPAGPKHVWNDISKTGDLLTELSEKDDGYKEINLPSSTSFYGEDFQKAYVNTNGYITLGAPSSVHGHFPLPSTMMPNNLIAPMAMDLNPAKGGKIYVEQTEDKLTVQYDKVKDFSGLGEYTFQAVLQSNGVVFFHYHNISEGETKATTGIQNASGDSGLLIAYNNDQITSGMSVRVSTAPKWLHISKSGGTVKAGQSENVEISLKSGMIQNGSYKSVLELTSNDPLKLNSEVPVSLTVKPSKLLTANPTHLNFGEVEVGLSKTLEVTLSNTGNAPIDLSSLQTEDAAFSSNLNSGIIKPGKSKSIEITFKPADGINYQSNSVLSSDADNGPHNISFSGIGLATPKLEIKPEIVTINVDAGSKGSEVAKIDNVKGQAAGTFKLVEIRSGKAGNSLSKFSEDSDSSSETIPADPFSSEHVPNELIVAFRNGANTFENLNNLDNGITILRPIGIAKKPGTGAKALANSSMSLIRNESKLSLSELAKKLAKDPAVEYVEPNYIVRHTGIPNDPKWDKQWALPKIEASKAWDSAVGSDSVIVAVIDTGIDYNHPDLEGNIWKNPGEIAGNNIDDDGNGFVDDIYGWDFCNDDNDPMDGQNHGTHVAGTIAAATNNGELVAGVSWHASLVGIKFLSDSGGGTTADAIDSIAYCAAMEFPISNNSWGGGGYSQALKDVIAEAAQNGHLFCAAAGNSASNNDTLPHYPSNYDLPSIISVAASNSSDKLAWFSCYGLKTVDLAAPGEGILSLVPNGGTATYSGTSMATPHVAGAAALLLSINSDYGHQELKNALMNSVDLISAFEGKMVAPGRLNLANAVGEAKPGWLTVTPDAGTVTAGSQEDLIFSADASEFNAGIKSAVAVFETNDPLATVIEVPVELTVTGSPVIQLSDQSLDFGTVWSNQSETHVLEVKNIGTDVLNITAMNFQDGIFSSEINGVILNPGKAQALVITAKPIGSGTVSSTLAISSNDNKNPVTVVDLKVTGMTPPSLTFNPESISLTLEKGLSEDRNVTITNSGEAEGVWDGYLVEIGADKSSQMDLMSALESIASRASVPEVRSPRMLSMNSQQILNLSDPQPVVRFESNPVSSMEVAVLGAAFDYENEDIANGLVATKTFAGVTMVNVSWVTPTLEELSAFDAIIVYSIDPYFDAEALGNVVADYAMAGGGVVTASHEGNTHSMEGKWTSEGLNIYPADDNYLNKKESMGDALVEGHPILANVKSFRGNSLHLRKKSPMDGKIIANWSGGTPLVTIREGHSKVADLSFWPVSDLADELGYFPGWDSKTDGWQLIANSLSWSALGNSPDWVTGNPLSGKVTGNSKEEMTLTIDAKNLEEGEYFAEVQFTTNDPVNSFSVVSVHLTVKENQPPVAESITVQGVEDNALDFALVASDPDGDTITYEILGSPTNGTITGKTPQLTYLPNPNFHGKDNLTFKVSDGAADSDVAEVIFEIEAQNDSPIVGSDEINGTEDEFIVIEFNHSDPDGDKLEVQITKLPENGFLWEENGMTLYFPDNHYNGQDEIRFTVSDGEVTSDEATIKINLDPQNDAPVAKELVFQTQQNQTVLITLNAEDVDGDSVSYDLVTLPGHGILKQITNSTWNYTPHEQFTGTDSLLYRANDSMMQSDLAKVSINVNEENNAPVVQDSTFSMQEDGNLPIKLIAADPEGDALTFEIVSAPSNGTLTGNGPKYEYTPDANFNGTDQFTVRANDGKLESNVAKISMLVTAQNDAPSFVKSINTMSSGLRETPYRLRLEVEDVDNDELTISVANNPKYGTCYLQNEELVYLPNPGFEGLEHIVLELSDGKESVQENFPISILSYHSPMEIQIDLEQDPQLLDMLYQANEILSQNGNSIFEVQKPSQGITLTAKLTQNLTNDGQDLNEWLSKLNEGVLEGDFQFLASKMEDGLKWKVAPLLDPASSADTHVNNESSYIEDVVTEKPGSSDTSSDPEPISDKQNSSPTDNRSNYASNPFIQDLGSNWYSAAGIGTFYDAGNGWIYEPNMGWSFLKVCPTNCSAWLFNENLGWLWFSTDLPNMMFSNNTGSSGWIFYPENSLGESQLVFNYTQTAWMQWK